MQQDLKIPKHIAIIMDGNGRWAKAQGMQRYQGHSEGAKTVKKIVEEARRIGVSYLTLYTFSSENWKRPEIEIKALMKLLESYLNSEVDSLKDKGIRLRVIGDIEKLPASIKNLINKSLEKTKDCKEMQLILALSYGGRQEIVDAVKKIALKIENKEISQEQITEDMIANSLYAADIPDPELMIRTSNEFRISNFLLWQLSYREFVFVPEFWPEFTPEKFIVVVVLERWGSGVINP